jgi:hypothetical protein
LSDRGSKQIEKEKETQISPSLETTIISHIGNIIIKIMSIHLFMSQLNSVDQTNKRVEEEKKRAKQIFDLLKIENIDWIRYSRQNHNTQSETLFRQTISDLKLQFPNCVFLSIRYNFNSFF